MIENTFTQDDTLEERIEKFNALTGLSLRLGDPWTSGERCLMDGNEHYTGPMDQETMMHWTAQVGGGYRLRMEQEMVTV